MDATDNTGKAKTPKQATGTNDDTEMAASSAAANRPFGPDGATILATEGGHAPKPTIIVSSISLPVRP